MLLAIFLLGTLPLRAQAPSTGAQLSGTILDPNGAVVPGGHTMVPGRNDNTFHKVFISVDPDGKLDLIENGTVIYNDLPTPFRGFRGARYNFGGRTGNLNENNWIDDVCINGFSLGAITITRQPVDVTVPELARARQHEAWAGLRPGTPDGLPILGKTATPGYFIASGPILTSPSSG